MLVPEVVNMSAPAPKLRLPLAVASPERRNLLSPSPKLTFPVSFPSAISNVSLPVPNLTSPVIDGAVKFAATTVCLMVAPVVLALRSIATFRFDVAAAPVAVMAPLFSISESVPDLSTMATAVPSVPPTAALISPLFLRTGRFAPASIATAVAIEPAVEPLLAAIFPELRSSGVLAPAPRLMAVAALSSDFA